MRSNFALRTVKTAARFRCSRWRDELRALRGGAGGAVADRGRRRPGGEVRGAFPSYRGVKAPRVTAGSARATQTGDRCASRKPPPPKPPTALRCRVVPAAALARRGHLLVVGRVGATGDLAERVAAALEVDHRPVRVAERAADALLGARELGGDRDARVAPAAAVELLGRVGAADRARERLAVDAADRPGERSGAHAVAGVGGDRPGQVVERVGTRRQPHPRRGARRRRGAGAAGQRTLLGPELTDLPGVQRLPLPLLGRGALPPRVADGGDQRDRPADGQHERDDDADPAPGRPADATASAGAPRTRGAARSDRTGEADRRRAEYPEAPAASTSTDPHR